ncbi:Histidinol-phosphate aminotransferase [Emticicia oligotrophica DSM 17448]|uniref:Histidinol-phosphate aminotransferase n=1 Tax=Emticicia oligotrophica (strain DSM 17448 / CIP 109782 / MTCC 6937 / GPTSA100-15) TaxID=929562 RepID=A0ABN4AP83_EMTOG|nr:histidinol-phosphate transaminase [Emticicia oligotrophica]AFK04163.1 Histidinol-phosphate aminotransferase [Emticicia oligotrophica DSM 17448]
MFSLDKVIRPHILSLTPYSSARDEYSGSEGTFLDANENPFGSVISGKYNRYPDPYQAVVKEKLAKIKKVRPGQIFLGNGSDEAIDLIIRATCEPKQDNILILPPTYGMYKVCADVQNVDVKQVPLTPDFQVDTKKVLETADANTKIIWICSPNNPSGNIIERASILHILDNFKTGLVVVDEAYIDFATEESFTQLLDTYPNLVVMQTFSKAWGLAALRLGMGFASEEIIKVLNKIKYPYNLNGVTQKLLYAALGKEEKKDKYVKQILKERERLHKKLTDLSIVQHIYPSDSNQLLVKFTEANQIFHYLIEQKIITRLRSNVLLCDNCIRISVGTRKENDILLKALKKY